MIHIAVRTREIVSSNVGSLVDKANDPAKMLRMLRREIEESLISLHGDRSRAHRRVERLSEEAKKVATSAEEWTAKARTAMDHGREDLARSALLAREDERKKAASLADEAKAAEDEAREIDEVTGQLEAKLAETRAQIAALPKSDSAASNGSDRPSKSERHLDRISTLEKRLDLADEDKAEPAPASVDAEIARLKLDSDIDAELAAMKGKSGKRLAAKRKRAK